MKLEDLRTNAAVRGLLPDGLVTVVNAEWCGSEALELTYKDPSGRLANQILYRDDEPRLEVVAQGRPWSFDGDGALFSLVAEARRLQLAHLYDPLLAVHTSEIDPLPHQITAVYEYLLPRQPLRYLLADDPGAGKTIMAGHGRIDVKDDELMALCDRLEVNLAATCEQLAEALASGDRDMEAVA